MKAKVSKITDQIVLIERDSYQDLAKTFIRFQEYYESPLPEIKGQIFTLGYLKNLYSTQYENSSGGFTYTEDFSGFNLPGYVLDPFIKGLFDPLTEDEWEIVELFRYRTDKFYIIGVASGADSTLNHEIAHGFWFTEDKYREKAQKFMSEYNLAPVNKLLKKMGYCKDLFEDECHAYIGMDYDYLVRTKGLEIPELKPLHYKLDKLFKQYR